MKKTIIILCYYTLLCVLLSCNVIAKTFEYLPDKIDGHQILAYRQFTISYNDIHEQPDWVAYELTEEELGIKRNRCNCFAKDYRVTTGSSTESDYEFTGFDKALLCPPAYNKKSDQASRECFLMSNISPQLPGFNSGIWYELESWVSDQAELYSTIFVVTGPAFLNNLGAIGENNKITIPGYFYKALLRFDDIFDHSTAKTIGFLLPHIGATGNIEDYAVPINTLESITGIDFFPELKSTIEVQDISIEDRVESQYDLSEWGF